MNMQNAEESTPLARKDQVSRGEERSGKRDQKRMPNSGQSTHVNHSHAFCHQALISWKLLMNEL